MNIMYACMTCKVFAESFMKTERAPPDVDTDKYIENLAVLVRLFVLCVWFDSLFTLQHVLQHKFSIETEHPHSNTHQQFQVWTSERDSTNTPVIVEEVDSQLIGSHPPGSCGCMHLLTTIATMSNHCRI